MKLTETQEKILAAYQQELNVLQAQINAAKQKFDAALFLIAGREFKDYEIKDGELIIKEDTKKK